MCTFSDAEKDCLINDTFEVECTTPVPRLQPLARAALEVRALSSCEGQWGIEGVVVDKGCLFSASAEELLIHYVFFWAAFSDSCFRCLC